MKTTTAKIARNKGQARIWLENSTLAKMGFNRYDGITIDYLSDGRIEIQRALPDVANHSVAGRERRGKSISIIDINCSELSDHVGTATTATVVYQPDVITITID